MVQYILYLFSFQHDLYLNYFCKSKKVILQENKGSDRIIIELLLLSCHQCLKKNGVINNHLVTQNRFPPDYTAQ